MTTLRTMLFLVIAAGSLMLVSSTTANAQYDAAIVTDGNHCLVPGADRKIYVMRCTDGGARYKIQDGRVSTRDGYCFDHGIARGMDPSRNDNSVKLVQCHGGPSQQWYFVGSKPNLFMAQNAANTNVCMDIKNRWDSVGTPVIVWNCGFGNRPSDVPANQRFYPAVTLTPAALAQLKAIIPVNIYNNVIGGGAAQASNGARIVWAGGGNIVAAGAGNLLSPNASNIVAAGAGNIVAQGGLNLISQDGGGLRGLFSGAGVTVSISNPY